MKMLRIKLRQLVANFRKEETINSVMTYPLPPLSTIIGMLHHACSYNSYHPMDISIQGNIQSIEHNLQIYQLLLANTLNDRATIVKTLDDEQLLTNRASCVVATAQGQGGSIYDNKKTYIHDLKKWKQYKESIDALPSKAIGSNRGSGFRSYLGVPTSVELVNDAVYILHISADEQTMNDIMKNKFKLYRLGRSEDFVDIIECKFVEVNDLSTLDKEICADNSAYMDIKLFKKFDKEEAPIEFFDKTFNTKYNITGTVYNINKDYKKVKKQRIFNKKNVLYVNSRTINQETYEKLDDFQKKHLFYDEDDYIVNVL